MEDKIVTLESYYDPMLAQIIRGRLEANGIPCFIADENTLSANPFYNQAIGGIKIKVFERDLDKCRAILAEEVEIAPGEEELITCPNCKSKNVYYGPAPVKRNWFSILVSFLGAVYPIYLRKTWICTDCGANFDQSTD
ncbi:MAG: hypothetical protein JWR50_2511 [Mucilaginibacter sp.]|nr:hypothetical protein [Mucilaginibacter sp.]